MRAASLLGLGGLIACALAVAAGAAGSPGLVPASRGGFHGWLAGPLSGLDLSIDAAGFGALLLAMFGLYLVVLRGVKALDPRTVVAAIVVLHLIFLLAPPLFSSDVFGYIAFARLGALHHLDPYAHGAAAAPLDPVFPYVGWHHLTSPYGPVFTLASYAVVPLGITGAFWALKATAAICSLAIVALVWRLALRRGLSPTWAIAFVGLNPLLLVYGVAGAHNDFLVMLVLLAGVLGQLEGRPATGGAAGAAAAAAKASAALPLPFIAIGSRQRRKTIAWMLAALAATGVLAVAAFGAHGASFVGQVRAQQHQVASKSVPNELGRLLGFGGITTGLRVLALACFALAVSVALVRARRGDWISLAAWGTLALLATTAWLLPWYVIWLLPLAAISGEWRLEAATVVFCAYVVVTRVSFLAG